MSLHHFQHFRCCYRLVFNKNDFIPIKCLGIRRKATSSELHAIEMVKKYDYENFLATLLIPVPEVRRCGFAVRALNVELSQIPDVTSKEITAIGRFMFWSQVLNEMYSGQEIKNQPVVKELKDCLKSADGKLSKLHFKRLVDSRSNTHSGSNKFPFETMASFESYCDSSVCPVYLLMIESLVAHEKRSGVSLDKKHMELDHVASHLSKAQGISNMLRGVAHNSRSGRCYIPNELLDKHRARHEDFLRYKETKEIFEVSFDLASVAKHHLDLSKSLMSEKRIKNYYYLFLPSIFVEMYLNRLQEANFNIFHKSLYMKQTNLPLKLWWKSLKLKYS